MVVALVELLLFGAIGVGRQRNGFSDTIYYCAAGRALLAGQNPYDPPTLRAHAEGKLDGTIARFYYPPQVAPLFMLLGLFPFGAARMVLGAFNIAATAGLCILALRALRQPRPTLGSCDARAPVPWLLPAIIVGDPWLVDSVWGGSVVPLVALCLMGGWRLAERSRSVLGGALLGLATMKPQFALLPLVWMACERQWKVLAGSVAAALVCMAYPLVLLGPGALFGGWFGTIRLHHEEWCNQLGWPHVMGASNLLFAFGVTTPDLKVVTVLLTVALWSVRRWFRREDILGILAAMSVTLLVAHDYDIVALVPLLAAYWGHLGGRPKEAAIALALATVLFIPPQLAGKIPYPWIHQRITVATLILLGWMVWLSSRRPAEAGNPQEVRSAPATGP
jgi:hypothetical protein